MKMQRRLSHLCLGILLLVLAATGFSAPRTGLTLSLPLITKEPMNVHGYQFMLNYDPDRFKWRQFDLYFDGGFSHFYVPHSDNYSSLNIYSMAPVVRYSFRRNGPVMPFMEFSIGLSYLNNTRLENRNLGIHFAFQDRIGIGALMGKSDNVVLGLHAIHYSNAHLSAHNSGITIPLMLDVGYRF